VVLSVGAAATLLGGRLADQFGRVVVLRTGYAIVIPGFVLLLFTASIPVAFVAVGILGVGLNLPFSVQVTLGQDYLPTEIGTASGVTLGLAVSASGLPAPLLGLIADHAGIRSSPAFAAVLPTAVLLITARLPETCKPSRDMHSDGTRDLVTA
jgi:FSR family fosmidomycin resistance protein-like MFS transporter